MERLRLRRSSKPRPPEGRWEDLSTVDRVRRIQFSNGLTQEEFAGKVGFSEGHVSKVFRRVNPPTRDFLTAVEDTFHLKPRSLEGFDAPSLLNRRHRGRTRQVD
jgi:transcriptional regulator with XRE-family HTH domain